jgi:hypothetical protein
VKERKENGVVVLAPLEKETWAIVVSSVGKGRTEQR